MNLGDYLIWEATNGLLLIPTVIGLVHRHDKNDVHEFYFMCADIQALIAELKSKGKAHGLEAGIFSDLVKEALSKTSKTQ